MNIDHIIVEIAQKCYTASMSKKEAYQVIKKHVSNNQSQADILHVLYCLQMPDSKPIDRLADTVKFARDSISHKNLIS